MNAVALCSIRSRFWIASQHYYTFKDPDARTYWLGQAHAWRAALTLLLDDSIENITFS